MQFYLTVRKQPRASVVYLNSICGLFVQAHISTTCFSCCRDYGLCHYGAPSAFSPFPPSLPISILLTCQCDGCLHGSLCVGVHRWVAQISNQGGATLSRGWLPKVEAPGYPRHPTYISSNECVDCSEIPKMHAKQPNLRTA